MFGRKMTVVGDEIDRRKSIRLRLKVKFNLMLIYT